MKAFRSLLFVCLLFLLFPMTVIASEKENRDDNEERVLFISSYSESFLSVPEQTAGIRSVFDPASVYMDIEYMDMSRFNNETNMKLFYETIKYKIENVKPYDAVIVADDAALQFVLDYQDELFAEMPIISLCINDEHRFQEAMNNPYMTGTMEITESLHDTLVLARDMRPNATKVMAIVDDTLTGQGDQKQFLNEVQKFPELEASFLNVSDYSFEEFGKVLEAIGDDTIVLYMCMFNDKNNDNMDINQASKFISQHTNVPVFRHSIGGVGNGILGGEMVDYYESGVIAANMVMQVLDGTPVSSIEGVRMSPAQYIIDYDIIEKYNIDSKLIPDDAVVINRELGFFEARKGEIIFFLVIVAVFGVIASILILDNIKRRKTLNKITEMNHRIEFQATHDYLTQLPNRFAFMKQLEQAIADKIEGAVFLIDLDNFKTINDTQGHIYGDKILVEISKKLESFEEENVFVSRHGGDEFLMSVYGNMSVNDIKEYAQRIVEIFAEGILLEGHDNFVSCSIGISLFPQNSDSVEQLIMYADTAMYKVKNEGKNNFMFYTNELNKEFSDKVQVEKVLRQAIRNEGFVLYYQPLVDVRTQETSGYEALLRLKDCNLSPAVFIPVAEELGLILEIGRWVTSEAIRQLAEWKIEGLCSKTISINFSNVQLRDDGYIEYIKQMLDKYDVSPSLLEIEITESILLRKTDKVLRFLHQIKDIGLSLVLDDFGTGYSSLNYLTYMPIDKVKLDKSLIDKFLIQDSNSFLKNLVLLLHDLDVKITAEGIEEAVQVNQIAEIVCDTIQGYFFSKPLIVEEARAVYDKVWESEID